MDLNSLRHRLNSLRELSASVENIKAVENSDYSQYVRAVTQKMVKDNNAQLVTKGWLKCMDMLQFIGFNGGNVFFNAELPGAFVVATNHYTATKSLPFDWLLSSFVPQGGDIAKTKPLEDTYGLLSANRFHRLVGDIETSLGRYWIDGDLTREDTPTILSELVANSMGKVDLYTADGGMDVTGKEAKQEEVNYPLIYNEFKTGVLSLKVGNKMIVKIYTSFTNEMRTLLSYITRFFNRIRYYKPSASSPFNSEVYFIGEDFIGPSEWNDIEARTGSQTAYPQDVLIEFVNKQINALSALIEGKQIRHDGISYDFVKSITRDKWIKTETK